MQVATIDSSRAATELGRLRSGERRSRRIAVDLLGFMEAAAVVIGGVVPANIYANVAGLQFSWLMHVQACIVSAALVYGVLANAGMYDPTRLHDLPANPGRLLGALVIAFMAVLGLGAPFAPRDVHMWVWYGTWMSVSFTALLGTRLLAREVLRRLTSAGRFDTNIAVYGSGVVAERVKTHLSNPSIGIRFAGLFDDRQEISRIDQRSPTLSGRLDDLVALGRTGSIDQIIVALPQAADRRTAQIAARLEHLPVSVHIVTHIASDLVDEGPLHGVSSLGPVGLLDVKSKPLADWSAVTKKAEDYVLGILLLILALPLMALIAVAIRLEGKGPILFRQPRRGLNLQPFNVFKFRTMHVTEERGEVRQATPNDPRVTRIGRMLRRYSLDELPQLFNVLRGEMSLVGPRPHAVSHDDSYAELLKRYVNRHQVKPGITGLAQVSGMRGQTDTLDKMEARVVLDLEYVRTWSLWLDLRILGRTILQVPRGHNAF